MAGFNTYGDALAAGYSPPSVGVIERYSGVDEVVREAYDAGSQSVRMSSRSGEVDASLAKEQMAHTGLI